jgi:hypothetical protein
MPIYLSVAGKLTDEYARIARFQRAVRTIRTT